MLRLKILALANLGQSLNLRKTGKEIASLFLSLAHSTISYLSGMIFLLTPLPHIPSSKFHKQKISLF